MDLAGTDTTYAWGFNYYGELGLGMDVVNHSIERNSLQEIEAFVCNLLLFASSTKMSGTALRGRIIVFLSLKIFLQIPTQSGRSESTSIPVNYCYHRAHRFDCKRSMTSGRDDLRYCLDTRPNSAGAVRFSYESVVRCRSCRQSLVFSEPSSGCTKNAFCRYVARAHVDVTEIIT